MTYTGNQKDIDALAREAPTLASIRAKLVQPSPQGLYPVPPTFSEEEMRVVLEALDAALSNPKGLP